MDKNYTPIEVLQKYWGFPSFRSKQEDIIQSVVSGKDTLALLPTGGGKSLCFQVPAMCSPGICVVVSPLIALMKDQVDQLNGRGIKSFRITSDLNKREIDIILDNCVYGQVKFLYVSPERLKTKLFLERFKKMPVNLIAVDEAHCLSQWGYDFRPSYLEIAEIRPHHPHVPVIALTATATPVVVKDIQEKLKFKQENLFKARFERPNLAYVVKETDKKYEKLQEICTAVVGTGIIYVASRKRTREIAEFLKNRNFSAEAYHAGLDAKYKNDLQERWVNNQIRIIVATNAFGMGIDKPDVHFVVHMDIPSDPESYFQEAGRAGRDGRKSYAVLICNEQDIRDLNKRLESKYPKQELVRRVYRALGNHLQIPIGSGQHAVYDFNMYDFITKYDFKALEAFHAIKLLESEGLIALNESAYNPSKVMLLVNRKELYSFQINHPTLNGLAQLLLRRYAGIFDVFVKIDERDIARKLAQNPEDLVRDLRYMQKLGVLHYIPQNSKAKLIFLEERIDEKGLTLSPENYRVRKEAEEKRAADMIRYIHNDGCRSIYLREYFDDMEGGECGVCDWCQENRKKHLLDDQLIAERIMELLDFEERNMEDLEGLFPEVDSKHLFGLVRWLIDEGRLEMDEGELLRRKND